MKILISLIVILPTLIAVLLFTVAGLSFNAPELLAAATNPAITTCCIVAGVIALIPLLIAAVVLIMNLISNSKSKNKKPEINGQKRDF